MPLMLLSNRFASVEQQKSLKSSSVKLAARDVAALLNHSYAAMTMLGGSMIAPTLN